MKRRLVDLDTTAEAQIASGADFVAYYADDVTYFPRFKERLEAITGFFLTETTEENP